MALAGVQILIEYEWLLADGDKLLFGGFPAQSGKPLLGIIGGGKFPDFFASLLREPVISNAMHFNHLMEWSETLAGLGLVRWPAGAAPPTGRTLPGPLARSDGRSRLPVGREASVTRSPRCGTPRSQLLTSSGWLARTLVHPQYCLWRFD